jgi:hypothetical protein
VLSASKSNLAAAAHHLSAQAIQVRDESLLGVLSAPTDSAQLKTVRQKSRVLIPCVTIYDEVCV